MQNDLSSRIIEGEGLHSALGYRRKILESKFILPSHYLRKDPIPISKVQSVDHKEPNNN